MGLDLKLFSISSKADFVLKKAKSNLHYAIDFDKILNPETLELHLKMIQKNPDGTPETVIQELIQDSFTILNYYPEKDITNYIFSSKTRGYDTINFLLKQYLEDKKRIKVSEIFYSGINIENESQWNRFQYIDKDKTKEINKLLESIQFADLLKYYDYQKMEHSVYKPTRPDQLFYLKEEFNDLKKFYNESSKLDAFVIVKIS